MAKLLVTGGTGLIGAELARQAAQAGHELTLIGRQRQAGPWTTVLADLAHPATVPEALGRERFDAVIYLAQAADHNGFPANASLAVAVNIAAPVALCQWAVQTGCPQFIYASSGGICGAESNPLRRIGEASPRQPSERLSFYLATKARCEELLMAFRPHVQLDLLRYFFVYGRAQRPNFLFPRLVQKIRTGEAIELAEGVGPWLNPIHAIDAAALTLKVLRTQGGGVTNIAGPDDSTLADVVQRMARCLQRPAVITSVSGERPVFLADTARMQARLGTPSVSLDDGIHSTFTDEDGNA